MTPNEIASRMGIKILTDQINFKAKSLHAYTRYGAQLLLELVVESLEHYIEQRVAYIESAADMTFKIQHDLQMRLKKPPPTQAILDHLQELMFIVANLVAVHHDGNNVVMDARTLHQQLKDAI